MQPNLRYLLWNGKNFDNFNNYSNNNNKTQFSKEINLNNWLIYDNNTNKYKFINNKDSIPFGIGKRDCLGQSLAMKEIEAFLANLILNYKILPPNQQEIEIKFTTTKNVSVVEPAIPVRIEKRTRSPIVSNPANVSV